MLDVDLIEYPVEVFTSREMRVINLPSFSQHAMNMKPEKGEALTWSVEGKDLLIHYLVKTDSLKNFPDSLLSDLVDGKAVLIVKSTKRADDYLIKAH